MSQRVVYQWSNGYGDRNLCLCRTDRTETVLERAAEHGLTIRFLHPDEHPTVSEFEADRAAKLAEAETEWLAEQQPAEAPA